MNAKQNDNELITNGKRLTVCIPQKMNDELCRRANEKSMKVSVYVRNVLNEHFEKHKE
jgi:hypothetical protein